MADPSKLVAGASAVYGAERFAKLYGEIGTIDAARMIQPMDGETIDLAGRPLTFINTPGHADHHHCIIDPQTNSAFTGDTLGVSYKALRDDNYAFLMPTTTPVQFNPQALHESIDKVMRYDPETIYLTHYSALKPNINMIAGLHEQIDDFVMLTQQVAEVDCDLGETLEMDLTDYLVTRCMNEISHVDENTALSWLKLDARLNAQGLAFWWEHRRTKNE